MARWRRADLIRAARGHALPEAHRRSVWNVCSVLLDYPTPELVGGLDALAAEVVELPPQCAQPLGRLLAHLRATPLRLLQEDYVSTFDHTRKCALFLTYFSYGDTRRRGVALVQFKQAYRRAGVEFDPGGGDGSELPDHLCAVLQFGATVDAAGAWRLLVDHRAGLEMLRLALVEAGSPWAGAVTAVCETLPELKGDDLEAVRRLVEQGPPAEEVGLEPYLIDPQIPVGQIPVGQIPVGPPTAGVPR